MYSITTIITTYNNYCIDFAIDVCINYYFNIIIKNIARLQLTQNIVKTHTHNRKLQLSAYHTQWHSLSKLCSQCTEHNVHKYSHVRVWL